MPVQTEYVSDRDQTRSSVSASSWRNSYSFVILIGISIGALAIVVSMLLDWAMQHALRPLYASDLLEGIAAGALSGTVLVRMQARRIELLKRMQIVEDVNHHVRNALTAISLSASLLEDPDLNLLVRDACNRVDWVLTDVLSQAVHTKDAELQHSGWNSGRLLNKAVHRKRRVVRRG